MPLPTSRYTIVVWDGATGTTETIPLLHNPTVEVELTLFELSLDDADADYYCFSRDGSSCATISDDGLVRVWRTRTGEHTWRPCRRHTMLFRRSHQTGTSSPVSAHIPRWKSTMSRPVIRSETSIGLMTSGRARTSAQRSRRIPRGSI